MLDRTLMVSRRATVSRISPSSSSPHQISRLTPTFLPPHELSEDCLNHRVNNSLCIEISCEPFFIPAQIIRDGTTTSSPSGRENAGSNGGTTISVCVKVERRAEVEDALRCLLSLTAHGHRTLSSALGLVAATPAPPGVAALVNLATEEGGAALQVGFLRAFGDMEKAQAQTE